MLGVIIREFREREKVEPIALLVIAKDTKVLFEGLVDAFCLSIGLRVEGSGLVAIDIAKFKEARGES